MSHMCTYPIIICDIYISSLLNKAFQGVFIAFSSSNVQGSSLKKKKEIKYISSCNYYVVLCKYIYSMYLRSGVGV